MMDPVTRSFIAGALFGLTPGEESAAAPAPPQSPDEPTRRKAIAERAIAAARNSALDPPSGAPDRAASDTDFSTTL